MTDDETNEDPLDESDEVRPRVGHIAFARIEPLTLQGASNPAEVIDRALQPGSRVTRHNRTWLVGQTHYAEGAIVGRIGFQLASITEVWIEEQNDFREEQLPEGTTSPFAIDPERLRVAFQLRPGLIRRTSFTGALQALLNEASPVDRWRVVPELEEVGFADWSRSVDRITRLRIRVERPNPHFGNRARIRELIQGTHARMADIVLQTGEDDLDGIDINDPFVIEALEHAERYGSVHAVGESDGKRVDWSSERGGAAEIEEATADPVTREVSTDALREKLAEGSTLKESAEALDE